MTATAPAPAAPAEPKVLKTATGTLSVKAPDGARFEQEEVNGQNGTVSLGNVPILIWEDVEKARAFYGDESILASLDGTSLRVSFQGIARRYAASGKTVDEIATAQINFRPGKRQVGESTPQSRAASAARRAQSAVGDSDALTKLLNMVAEGKLSQEQIARLTAGAGK